MYGVSVKKTDVNPVNAARRTRIKSLSMEKIRSRRVWSLCSFLYNNVIRDRFEITIRIDYAFDNEQNEKKRLRWTVVIQNRKKNEIPAVAHAHFTYDSVVHNS